MTQIGYSLTTIVERAPRLKQVYRSDLRVGDRLFVKTRNSLYTIRVVGGNLVSVTGGWFDRKGLSPKQTTIVGCTWGGSVIKVDIVAACGLHLEFGNRLITTEIQKIFLLPNTSEN